MIETAMLKVFTTDRLWEAVNDAFQIHGGSAYFDDNPLGRMLRDARINQIGEGSNEVLTSFIALVGMRGPGMEFKEIYDTMTSFSMNRVGKAWNAGMNRLARPVVHAECASAKRGIARFRRTTWPVDLAIQSSRSIARSWFIANRCWTCS